MKQVVQDFRTGELVIEEVPQPALKPGGVLVRTACSLISAGTERTTIQTAQSSLLGKARSRPDLVRQVFDTFKREGFRATYKKVTAKLNQVKALGYSAAGVVVEVGRDAEEFRAGDLVACAGAGYASHAEVNYVPRNLCAKVPEGVSMETASYATLGAIALHGVRQVEARLGETVAVIGLGLVGQLTVQLLKAAGCQVLGTDIDDAACTLATLSGADRVAGDSALAKEACDALSHGRGADCIVIAAATKSSQPLELAAELARDRARVTVVGLVGMDVPRSSFYNKELELRLSRSYGPGRYDVQYEERGHDYPVGYVRWTEKRNMEAFLQLAAGGKLNTDILTSHRFPVAEARRAYDLILNPSVRHCGVVLEYPEAAALTPISARRASAPVSAGELGVSVIGAGSFARGVLLPILRQRSGVKLLGVSAANGINAKNTASQFGFAYAVGGYKDILDDDASQVVFIATRHDLHARLAAEALRRGKSVFVEKPLAIDESGVREVAKAARESQALLMVGYNRRFSPLAIEVKDRLAGIAAPLTICYRVNAGKVPADHWTLDPAEGGGRMIGEVCHFIDLVQFLTGALPLSVSAYSVSRVVRAGSVDDSTVVSLNMSDGSVASIVYAASGDASVRKERMEVFCGESYALIDDFREGIFARGGTEIKLGKGRQDKGHAAEIEAFLGACRRHGEPPISLEGLVATTLATLGAVRSASGAAKVDIDLRNFLSEL